MIDAIRPDHELYIATRCPQCGERLWVVVEYNPPNGYWRGGWIAEGECLVPTCACVFGDNDPHYDPVCNIAEGWANEYAILE